MKSIEVAAIQISRFIEHFIAGLDLDLSFRVLTHPGEVPDLTIRFFGSDVLLLTANDGELLHSLEILSSGIRAPENAELLSCIAVEAVDQPLSQRHGHPHAATQPVRQP